MTLSLFEFRQSPVRVIIKDGSPWFVAKDLCTVLGLGSHRVPVSRLDPEDKTVETIQTPGGAQQLAIVNESGMYSLVLTSRKEEAKAFKRWITAEVLPQIRKTGSYGIQGQADDLLDWFRRLALFRSKTRIPIGYFCIFEETIQLLADFEEAGYRLPPRSVPDISIGKCFCNYLRQIGKYDKALIREYLHCYPDGRQVMANIYHLSLLPIFKEWFAVTYKVDKLKKYLASKDPSAKEALDKVLATYEDDRRIFLKA